MNTMHSYIKQLTNENISKKHAEAIVDLMLGIKQDTLAEAASKDELEQLSNLIKQEISAFRVELQKLELRMVIKLGTIVAFATSILASLFKVLL